MIEQAGKVDRHSPQTLQTSFQGTAQEFQSSLATQPILIATALFAVYVVLGVLYESFIHPFTIFSACRRRRWGRCSSFVFLA